MPQSNAQFLASQRGGLKTKSTYGRDFYVSLGKKGGRPRKQTLEEIREQRAPENNN